MDNKKNVKYKDSIFKEYTISADATYIGNSIYMNGFVAGCEEGKEIYKGVCCNVDNIKEISTVKFRKTIAAAVSAITDENEEVTIFLPGFDENDIIDLVEEERRKQIEFKEIEARRLEEKWKIEARRLEEAQKKQLEIQKKEKQREEYYKMQFTDLKEREPVYVFEENEEYVTFLYIDKNKSINIRSIDKSKMQLVESTVSYNDIHYYEKAGTIHYVSDINISGDLTSFAGSFVPTKIGLTPAIVGGLLFGPMGLAVGTMMGIKPAHFEAKNQHSPLMNIDSKVHKIDDRSVILNYYSEKHKQFMDVELPQEIYNFLQTHLAEKKYDIVLSVEKQKYASYGVAQDSIPKIEAAEKNTIEDKKMDLDEFEKAVKKLKIMLDNDLISEEEFRIKKTELLNNI